jgi:hypothetical protein
MAARQMKTPDELKISQTFWPEASSFSDIMTKSRPVSSAKKY